MKKRKNNAPCYGCTERYPGCQTAEKCSKWAAYAEERKTYNDACLSGAKSNEDYRNVRHGARKRRRYRHA